MVCKLLWRVWKNVFFASFSLTVFVQKLKIVFKVILKDFNFGGLERFGLLFK